MQEKDLPDWASFQNEVHDLRRPSNGLSPPFSRHTGFCTAVNDHVLVGAGYDGMSFEDYYRMVLRICPAVETFTNVRWDVPMFGTKMEELFRDPDLYAAHNFPSVELISLPGLFASSWTRLRFWTGPTRQTLLPSSHSGR
jgi:hypothetical protein